MRRASRLLAALAAALCLLAFAGAPAPAWAEEGATNKAVFRCLGDFVPNLPVVNAARTEDGEYDFHEILADVADLIGDADFTVANVDGVMGANEEYAGYPLFSTPVGLMETLADLGVDMLTLANNHALDYNYEGLLAELDACDALGMDHIGASRTQEEHDTPQVREINGIRVGFLNYTTGANGRERRSGPEATAYGLNLAFKSNYVADVQALRDAGAEVVIAFMHWGTEYQRDADSEEKMLASRLVAAGVDVIVGGHPHMVQRIAWLHGQRRTDGAQQTTLCCYSLGNFISNQQAVYQNCGIIFEFTLEKDADGRVTVHSPGYIPVYVWRENAEQGYHFRVLATERWLEEKPEGMSNGTHGELKYSWKDTVQHLGSSPSLAECIHIQ